jgi:signal transduction histidine kinase
MIDAKPRGYFSQGGSFLKTLSNYIEKITELRVRNKELQKITENQQKIISILAHDVRNPLASIKSIIEFKQSDIIDAKDAGQMMDMVTGQLNNTLELVDNIVNWGQLHLQHGQLFLEDIDMHAMVQQIFGSELLNSEAKNNTLLNHITPGDIVHSDKHALEFILRNLVSNANKFTENGSIAINMQKNSSATTLWVTDTGIGMNDKQADAVWSGDAVNSTPGTQNEKGNGIGLMLIKEFIGRLGGTITIESAVDTGTCFKIVLNT